MRKAIVFFGDLNLLARPIHFKSSCDIIFTDVSEAVIATIVNKVLLHAILKSLPKTLGGVKQDEATV